MASKARWRAMPPSYDAASALLAAASLLAMTRATQRGDVGSLEARVFRALNRRGTAIHGPVWVVMQAGSFPSIAVVAAALRRRNQRASMAAAIAGTAAWGLAKVVKRIVGRGRPADHLHDVVVRGEPQRGHGFPSGHAAVAAALVAVGARTASPWAARGGRVVVLAVGFARQYVGAHLPVDVAGGLALGAGAGAVTNLVIDLGV
jgi:membrane-associated phospholipid phosphatase